MSWHFSRALVGDYSEACCVDLERFAPLKLSHTPQAYCSKDRMKAFSRLSRSGMTFAPLTEDLGEELLTWFREGFHARTSVSQDQEQGSQAHDLDSGKKWPELLARWDQASSSWRTRQRLLLGDLELFSGTWPRWGMMRNGECWERTMPGHHTSGTGFGLWPTPAAIDYRGANSQQHVATNGTGRKHMDQLPNAVIHGGTGTRQTWSTPCAQDYRRRGPNSKQQGLPESVHLENKAGQLNPDWVEWLMGWPIGWTDLRPLGMDRFQQWLDLHGKYCTEEAIEHL